jgi:hypothetical protein
MLDAALEYAQREIPVFPCNPLDKKPLASHGFKDATTNETQIRAWWTKWPNAMIGIPTGSRSGMWVLDTDVDPAKNVDGEAALAKLITQYGSLPRTLTSTTPRGGRHRLFIWPNNIEIRNSTGKLGPGIDVRGEGGYAVLPPSSMANGAAYRWDTADDTSKTVYAPDWLVEHVRAETRAQRRDKTWATTALDTECARVAAARAGTRNNTLNEAAFNLFQIVAGGLLSDHEVRNRLLEAATACGLVADDGAMSVVRTIGSGAQAGSAQPRTRPGGPALPPQPPPPPPPPPGAQPQPGPQPAAPQPTRPMIRLESGELIKNVDAAEAALIAAGGLGLYQRGSLIVRPILSKLKAANGRRTFGWTLVPLIKPFMVETMMRAADFEQWDARARRFVPKDCPEKLAETYLARSGHWQLPVLAGVTNTPFLRADGSLCEQPGYDVASQLLFEPNGRIFPAVPLQPTQADAVEALKYLETVIRAFPFVQPVDRSVALSGILTALDRRAMMTAPLHAFTAPTARTGKSLLVDIASLLATGQLAPVIAQGSKEDEFEKRLDAALIAGDLIVNIDNCNYELTSSRLCQMLTQQRLIIRVLGFSKQIEVMVNASVYATGNNLTIANDMTDRTLLCSLDAGCERPGARHFDFDVVEDIHTERERLVVAALTMLRAWHIAGVSQQVDPMGGFEDWSRRVRGALIWLGRPDPCDSLAIVHALDPGRAEFEAVVLHWEPHLRNRSEYTVQDLINAGRIDGNLYTALMAVAANRSGPMVSNERLGWWLRKHDGWVRGNLKLVRARVLNGYPLWTLKRV